MCAAGKGSSSALPGTRSLQEFLNEDLQSDEFRYLWEDPRKMVGWVVQHTRLQHGWSQRELAQKLGTSQNQIYMLENGKRDTTVSTLRRLSEVLGISFGWLLLAAEHGSLPPGTIEENPRSESEERIAENKDIVRRVFEEAINGRDLEVVDVLFSAELVDRCPVKGQRPGAEGIKQAIQGYIEAFPNLEVTLEWVLGEGDKVVTCEVWRGTQEAAYEDIAPPPGSDLPWGVERKIDLRRFHDFRIEEGKIVETGASGNVRQALCLCSDVLRELYIADSNPGSEAGVFSGSSPF